MSKIINTILFLTIKFFPKCQHDCLTVELYLKYIRTIVGGKWAQASVANGSGNQVIAGEMASEARTPACKYYFTCAMHLVNLHKNKWEMAEIAIKQ
jgi:hypothetical protein